MDVLACKRSRRAKLTATDVDDTLVLILERIDSLVSLIRAASTCRRWRRLIADAGFLRRWRFLHGPPVAGDYYNRNRIHDVTDSPLFVPSSSIDARHFSLDFVEDLSVFESWGWPGWDINPAWEVRDSRGSLLLMECIPEPFLPGPFPKLVVCEPLTRRYLIVPPPDFNIADCMFPGTYLVDGDEDEAGGRIGMSNFRVLCMLLSLEDNVAHTTMFTVGGDSGGDTGSTWSENALRLVDPNVRSYYLGHVLGLFYYYVQHDGTLITRDDSTGKLSSSVLSLDIKNYWPPKISAIDGRDGEPRIVAMTDHHFLEVFARMDGQWGLEKKVLLSKVTRGLPGSAILLP